MDNPITTLGFRDKAEHTYNMTIVTNIVKQKQTCLNAKCVLVFSLSAIASVSVVNNAYAAEQEGESQSSAASESSAGTESRATAEKNKGNFLEQYLPTAKLSNLLTASKEPLHHIYTGVGFSQRLLHGNLEWVNPYGIGYVKAGAFNNSDRPFGAQVGFRYPYYLTNTDGNGYYIGVYAGHLDNKELDGEAFQPIGAGVDLSYVMLDRSRISTFSIGIGAAQGKEGKKGTKQATEPQIQFAYSLSLGVF